MGSFSPHEAFAIGGTNSVRGYEEGALGSGRSYVVGSGEISFPLVSREWGQKVKPISSQHINIVLAKRESKIFLTKRFCVWILEELKKKNLYRAT